jgi:hypothetical protein
VTGGNSLIVYQGGTVMWHIFEQPWTLLGAAVIVLLGVLTFRSVWPEKRQGWQWLLPVGVAALGLGLDLMVTTDFEKIRHMMTTAMRAAEQEDCAALGRLIASNYSDSFHQDKRALLDHCRARLVTPAVERVKKLGAVFEITPPRATVTLTVSVRLEQGSYWVRTYGITAALVKAQLWLSKQSDGSWLVTRIEVEEVNKAPAGWRMARDCPHRIDLLGRPKLSRSSRSKLCSRVASSRPKALARAHALELLIE